MRIGCRDLCVAFESEKQTVVALEGVSLAIPAGQFVSVVGPSGCGKTSLLRTFAGFLKPHDGELLPASGLRFGTMVYQENSLFPWMTVMENACFGMEAQGIPLAERESKARILLDRFGLSSREQSWPWQLSAGMKQRVAVIRSFLSNPDLLLMDEPFGALDCQLRMTLQQELLGLWEQSRSTVVFVTHDVDEAILLSDRVVVLSGSPGKVIGEYDIPFDRPRSLNVTLTGKFLQVKAEICAQLGLSSQVEVSAHAVR